MKQPTKKEIPSAGFCIIRPDIIKQGLSLQLGNLKTNIDTAMPYRWLNDDEGFQVFIFGNWRDAESIDFNFLSSEKEITKQVFKNYDYSNAMEEIKDWSAKDLKEFLRHCGYTKTYVKDIMIGMVRDLARIHRWKIKLESKNPFLVK